MACDCSGRYDWDREFGKLVCHECGKVSPYQPVPSQAELLKENEKLKEQNSQLIDDILRLHNALMDASKLLGDTDKWYKRLIVKHLNGGE